VGRFGDVYVVDTGGNRVVWLSCEGKFLGEVGGLGSEPGRFRNPSDIWVWGLDVYVADGDNRRIQRFDRTLRFLGSYRTVGGTPIGRPEALAVSEGGAFLVDGDGGRMWHITSGQIFPFGQGVLRKPAAVAVEEGRVWVADPGRGEVLVFDRSGAKLGAFGRGKFGTLVGIGAGEGICWAADGAQVWAVHYEEGVLGSIGEPSQRPVDVAVGQEGRIYVLGAGGKVFVFGPEGGDARCGS